MCDDLEDLALDWVLVMRASEEAERRRPEFEEWLQRKESHRVAYEEASGLWDGLADVVIALRQENRTSSPKELLSQIAEVARRRLVKPPH